MISAALAVLETDEQRNELYEFHKKNKIVFSQLHLSIYIINKIQRTLFKKLFLELQINQINSFRFQEPSNVFYVSAIVRNVSIDMFKKKNKHQTDNISEDIIYQSEPELPENPLLEKISHDEILDFLNNLPPLQRNVLILTCLSELSTSETAEVLKISKSAVYQRLYLAIKSIRTFIEGRNNK